MSSSIQAALITGGAKRVGRAIVQQLAANGFDGVFTYHSSDAEANSLVRQLGDLGRRFVALRADLTRPEEAAAMIGQAVENSFGRLDLLVNNASLYEPTELASVTPEQSRRMFDIHFQAPLLLCQRLAPLLHEPGKRRQHGGSAG